MAQTKKSIRDAYNANAYREFKVRVRRRSELCLAMESTVKAKGTSLNYIITHLLSEHFDVPFPNPWLDDDIWW